MSLLPAMPWSPSGDERAARAAADLWRGFASQLECVVGDLQSAAQLAIGAAEGQGIDAFSRWWEGLAGRDRRHLHDLVASARAVAAALDAYADALRDARLEAAERAAAIAASVAVGAALAWATAGAGTALAAGAVGAAAAEAAAVSASLAVRVGAIARLVGLHATMGAVEGIAAHAIVEPAVAAAFRPNDDPFAAYTRDEFALAAITGAVLPGWRGLRRTAASGALDDVALAGRPLGLLGQPHRAQHWRDLAADLSLEVVVDGWEHARTTPGDDLDAAGVRPKAGP